MLRILGIGRVWQLNLLPGFKGNRLRLRSRPMPGRVGDKDVQFSQIAFHLRGRRNYAENYRNWKSPTAYCCCPELSVTPS